MSIDERFMKNKKRTSILGSTESGIDDENKNMEKGNIYLDIESPIFEKS